MLKKTVQYENFDGQQASETFYFHMSQAELLRWEASLAGEGGLHGYFVSIMESGDGAKIMAFMEELIGRAIGKKSPDGSRFEKNQQITEDFRSSLAYDAFFMGLVTDPENAAEFMNGIVPKQLMESAEKLSKLEQVKRNVEERQSVPAKEEVTDPAEGGNVFELNNSESTPLVISPKEAKEMSQEELVRALQNGATIASGIES